MGTPQPFLLDVYGQDFTWRQSVTGVEGASFNPKGNAVGTGSITLPDDHAANEWMQADGARVTCVYDGGLLMSGPVLDAAGTFETAGAITYTLEDDYREVRDALAWVVPQAAYTSSGALQPTQLSDDGQAISTVAHTAGTDAGYGAYVFDSATRSAETAIKEVLRKNLVQRLGRPITILPDQQRGGDAYTAGMLPVLRFDPIADGLANLLKWSGLRLMIWQDRNGTGLKADVYAGQQWPQLLTADSGIIVPTSARWRRGRPAASRVVVGGPGDGTARAYRSVVNAAREAQYGLIQEVFREAGSAPMNWDASVAAAMRVEKYYRIQSNAAADIAAFDAAMQLAGTDALTEGAATSDLSLELAETETFRYGGARGIQIMDPVRVSQSLTGTPVFQDVVTEATVAWTASAGRVATPQVGQKQQDPDAAVASALVAMMRAARRRAASR